jgi:hypothetical protein
MNGRVEEQAVHENKRIVTETVMHIYVYNRDCNAYLCL